MVIEKKIIINERDNKKTSFFLIKKENYLPASIASCAVKFSSRS